MARLLLFRHAKALRDDPALPDFDRPLAARGERDAEHMGERLNARGLVPERVLCSTALRTRQTLVLASGGWPAGFATEFRDDLYNTGAADYLDIIATQGEPAATLMLVGHNPMIEAAMQLLLGAAAAGPGAKFSTAAVAVIEIELISWRAITAGSGRLAMFLRPGDA